MKRVYNFSAGPAMLPTEVMLQAQQEFPDWHGKGMSVAEISHRSKEFVSLSQEIEKDLREILSIPDDYYVLFLQGGARSQFAMVPMNLLQDRDTADYVETGTWSHLAVQEAKKYCRVNIVASSLEENYTTIPEPDTWKLNPNAAFFHYADNETIHGVEFSYIPDSGDVPLSSDMSSNLLSRPFDVSRFGVIYACAQKNFGIAGLTVVIVRKALVGEPLISTPSMFDYKLQAENHSLYNTAPTFPWYMAGLVFKWIKKQGGLSQLAIINQRKADRLYKIIDDSSLYYCPVDPQYRSRMNIVFRIRDEESLQERFLTEAAKHHLMNLRGHRTVGGIRASIYNGMPEEGVEALADFMQSFETQA